MGSLKSQSWLQKSAVPCIFLKHSSFSSSQATTTFNFWVIILVFVFTSLNNILNIALFTVFFLIVSLFYGRWDEALRYLCSSHPFLFTPFAMYAYCSFVHYMTKWALFTVGQCSLLWLLFVSSIPFGFVGVNIYLIFSLSRFLYSLAKWTVKFSATCISSQTFRCVGFSTMVILLFIYLLIYLF